MTQKLLAVLFTAVLFFNYSYIVQADSQQFTVDLHYGLTSNYDVKILQSFLSAKGYYTGATTGNYFSLTSQAVKKFQAANNLPATGYFGPMSRILVNKLVTANQATQGTTTLTSQPASNQNTSSASSTPQNTTLCNGTYWSACPAGQDFVCPASGNAYCQPQQVPLTPATVSAQAPQQDAALKIAGCQAKRDAGYSKFAANVNTMLEQGKTTWESKKQTAIDNLPSPASYPGDLGFQTWQMNVKSIETYVSDQIAKLNEAASASLVQGKAISDSTYSQCISQ